MAVTLATLRDQAKSRVDMVADSVVSDAEWLAYINAAYAELWDLLVAAWDDYFVVQSTIATSSGQDRYALGSLSPPLYKLLGVDILLSSAPGNYVPMHRFEWADRGKFVNNFITGALMANGIGLRYCLQANNIVFAPVPDGAYSVKLTYVPQMTAMVNDSDTIDAAIPAGFEDYIVVGAGIRARTKTEEDISGLVMSAQAIEKRIESMAPDRDALEPPKMTGRTDSLSMLDPSLRRRW